MDVGQPGDIRGAMAEAQVAKEVAVEGTVDEKVGTKDSTNKVVDLPSPAEVPGVGGSTAGKLACGDAMTLVGGRRFAVADFSAAIAA